MKKVVMLVLLAPTLANAAGRVVYNNFESGSSIGKCAIGSSAFDGGRAYAGSGMAICNWDGARKAADWQDPLADITFDIDFSYQQEFFVRFKQRADADYDNNSAGAKWLRFGNTNSIFQLDNNEVHWTFCSVGAPGCNETIDKWSVPMADSIYSRSWHEWAIYYRNGSSGRVVVWLDGQVMGEYSGPMGSASHSPISFGSNWSVNPGWEHDADNHRYIDEVEIYSDSGSGASGSMEAGTIMQGGNAVQPPPEAPQPTPTEAPTPSPVPTNSATNTDTSTSSSGAKISPTTTPASGSTTTDTSTPASVATTDTTPTPTSSSNSTSRGSSRSHHYHRHSNR